MTPQAADALKPLHDWSLADLESVRLLLRGESVIDWHRLNLANEDDVRAILSGNEFSLDDPADLARTGRIKDEAIEYLRRHFEFPIPKAIEKLSIQGLMMQASGKGHRQLCACTILKCMHVIHHLEGRELRYNLTLSDQEMFRLVEEKVYRVVGGMLAAGLPITEFVGGRKNKYSLYTKLLSKQDNIAAQIYDKQRFRIVTRSKADIFPVLLYLARRLFAFNYVIPGQSTNTVFALKSYCDEHPRLAELAKDPRANEEERDDLTPSGNDFSAKNYRIIHFVVDLPVRVPERVLAKAPASARQLGSVIFALVEFQILDRETEAANETGDASHDRYKERQRQAVMRRMKLGARGLQALAEDAKAATPPPPKTQEK